MATPPNPNQPPAGPPPSGLLPPALPPAARPPAGYYPDLQQQHAETAKMLARSLVGILAGSILLQYVCVMLVIWFRGNANGETKVLDDLFHVWLPVLAGLAGSAATYYFTTRNGK